MNVFFDLDGTLIDPFEGISRSVEYALDSLGHQVPPLESLRWVIGPPLIESFKRLGVNEPDTALSAYRKRYGEVGLFEAEPYQGMIETLAHLQDRGHRLVLMTAKPHVFARRITDHFGISPFLSDIYGPELDGTLNDKAELLAHALSETNIDPARSAIVGDREQDFDAGQQNGVATIAAAWGFGTEQEIALADHRAETILDVPPLIEHLAGE